MENHKENSMDNDIRTGFALGLKGIILSKHRSCFEFAVPYTAMINRIWDYTIGKHLRP